MLTFYEIDDHNVGAHTEPKRPLLALSIDNCLVLHVALKSLRGGQLGWNLVTVAYDSSFSSNRLVTPHALWMGAVSSCRRPTSIRAVSLKDEVARICPLAIFIRNWGLLGLLSIFVHDTAHDRMLILFLYVARFVLFDEALVYYLSVITGEKTYFVLFCSAVFLHQYSAALWGFSVLRRLLSPVWCFLEFSTVLKKNIFASKLHAGQLDMSSCFFYAPLYRQNVMQHLSTWKYINSVSNIKTNLFSLYWVLVKE